MLNDNAVFTAATGYVYTANPGEASPTPEELKTFDVAAPTGAWKAIGHTADEDLPEFGSDGGDKEVKGTWQKKQLKEVTTDSAVDYVTVKMVQFDAGTFEMYYGKNSETDDPDHIFSVATSDTKAIEKALLIVIVDGDYKIAFHVPKASIRRDDSISLSKDEFSQMPIRATFVKHGTDPIFKWVLPKTD